MSQTKIIQRQVDDPIQQNAEFRYDKFDRKYVDDQVRGTQQHVVDSLISGYTATWLYLDEGSPPVVVGDAVCGAGTGSGAVPKVTKATGGPLASSGGPIGIVVSTAAPGSYIRVATAGVLPTSITGLSSGSNVFVRINTTTARCERVASITGSDYQIGTADGLGCLTIAKSAQATGGGAPTGAATSDLTGNYPGPTVWQINNVRVPWKGAARAVITSNQSNLAAVPVAQDGITLVAGDRVLLAAQSTGGQNGIYTVGVVGGGTAPLTRSSDMAASVDCIPGSHVHVSEGTIWGNTEWTLRTQGTITLGTTALTFTPDRAQTIASLRLVAGKVSGETVELPFRSATNDGGGGTFVWKVGAQPADDDGVTIIPSVTTAGWWQRRQRKGEYDARWYGFSESNTAAGNVAAVMNAVTTANAAGGGKVILPGGVGQFPWKVPNHGATTGCFYLTNIANVTIEGAGMFDTVLKDPQAASLVNDFVGNGDGRNAFMVFVDPVKVRVRHIGFYGAAKYDQASLNLGGVTSREGVSFISSATGPKQCLVEYCWFTHTEGENFVVQSGTSTPAEDCVCRFSRFERVLDNIVNINCGTKLGSFRCGGHDNTIIDSGAGALFLAGGTDLFFQRNTATWTGISESPGVDGSGDVLIQGADLVDLSSYDSPHVTHNVFRGYRILGGTTLIHCGGLGGGFDACNGATLTHNKFIDCSYLGVTSGRAGGIVIDGTLTTQTDFLIEENRWIACFGSGGATDLAGVRVIGTTDPGGHPAQACAGTIGINHHSSGGVTHPVATAVHIHSTTVAAQDIRVNPQNCDPTMATPYVFDVTPKMTGFVVPPHGGGLGAKFTCYAGNPNAHVPGNIGDVLADVSTPAWYQKTSGAAGSTSGWSRIDGSGYVLATRAINTTAPLTGGGDLSADRTLAISNATTGAVGVVQLTEDLDNTALLPRVKHLTGNGGFVGITAGTILRWDSTGAQLENSAGELRLRSTGDVVRMYGGDGTHEISHWQYASGNAFQRIDGALSTFSILADAGTSQAFVIRVAGTTPQGMFLDANDIYFRSGATSPKGRFINTGFRVGDSGSANEMVDIKGRISMDLSSAPATPVARGVIYLDEDGNLHFKGSAGTDTLIAVA